MLSASVDVFALVDVRRDKKAKLRRCMFFQPYDQMDAGCRNWPSRIEFSFYHMYTIGRTWLQGELGKVKLMRLWLQEENVSAPLPPD